MGGEKCPGAGYAYNDRGSPPHGRGKESQHMFGNAADRITPAWAGKSELVPLPPVAPWDHPRMGGEKVACSMTSPVSMGSPPHGRGKVVCFVCCWIAYGITPAWAGKSTHFTTYSVWLQDHPRMGGEKVVQSV